MSGSHILILGVILVIFVLGPAKLPQLGRSLGDAIRGFKKGLADDEEIDVTNTTNQKLAESQGQDLRSQKVEQKDKV